LHRPALYDDPKRFGPVLEALGRLGRRLPLLFAAHPRTRASILTLYGGHTGGIRLIESQGYLDFVKLQAGARLVLTDSGGVQEETTVLGVPCMTLRDNTERPVTVTDGTNHLVGLDPGQILRCAEQILSVRPPLRRPALWDGDTAERIVKVLMTGSPPEITRRSASRALSPTGEP
jgi:UDP-N-acetylglucosamine 2-epimerase (non-hydrolysing)